MANLQPINQPTSADELTNRHAIFLDLALMVAARHGLLPPALQDEIRLPATEAEPVQQRVFEQ